MVNMNSRILCKVLAKLNNRKRLIMLILIKIMKIIIWRINNKLNKVYKKQMNKNKMIRKNNNQIKKTIIKKIRIILGMRLSIRKILANKKQISRKNNKLNKLNRQKNNNSCSSRDKKFRDREWI